MRTDGRFAMAVHVLAVLAYKDGDPVCSEFISASVNTNPVIIRRLLLLLQRARLVETTKGARAGSRLTRSPARINLAEVYHAIGCACAFGMPRKRPNTHCPVGSCISSFLKGVFTSAETALEKELARTTVADLLQQIKPPRAAASRH